MSAAEAIDRRIGARITDLRRERGLSVEALAEAVGLSAHDMERTERGERRASLRTLWRICRLLGCEVRVLFRAEDV